MTDEIKLPDDYQPEMILPEIVIKSDLFDKFERVASDRSLTVEELTLELIKNCCEWDR